MNSLHKIVLGITGASGAVYARKMIEILHDYQKKQLISEAAVVFTEKAKEVWNYELGLLSPLPFKEYHAQDFTAPFASGSSDFNTMIICPCSMGMLGRIAHGISNDLISRSADVMLKERRKLILVIRESPLNLIHIRNMEIITLSGGIILPACPSFYSRPNSSEEIIMTIINRVLSVAGIPHPDSYSWGKK